MIIKNDFFNTERDYLMEEKEGLNKAISNFDKRFKKKEVSKEKFLEQNLLFAKRQKELNKKIEKLDRK